MGHSSKDDAGVPAPADLAGWKKADYRLSGRFADHLYNCEQLRSPRALRRYFDDDDALRLLDEHEKRGVAPAYSSWGMLDYRPAKTRPTQAEQLLAEGLPPAQAMLLQARIDAHPTIYRVTTHDPKNGSVDLEDVLLGGCVTVYDRLMSQNIENGLFLPARAFSAGQFHFIEMIGPPLGAAQGLDAIDFLCDKRMVFTREGLRRGAHKFGWLWRWSDEWAASWRRPQLRNMDGHDLLFHTASFFVQDPASVRTTLLDRPNIDYDEEAPLR